MSNENMLPDWKKSPAIVRTGDSDIEWLPEPHNDFGLFADLEAGLEITIHDDLKQYYGAFWSDGVCCQSEHGPVQLIQIWNESDLDMLRENLLGHAFMKNKKRQPLTFFFGVAEGENMLTVDNAKGLVYMEVPGRRPHRMLANSLAIYLNSLKVTLERYGLN